MLCAWNFAKEHTVMLRKASAAKDFVAVVHFGCKTADGAKFCLAVDTIHGVAPTSVLDGELASRTLSYTGFHQIFCQRMINLHTMSIVPKLEAFFAVLRETALTK